MIDDATAAYIVETRKPFEDLRQVASQLAGILVLAACGARSATPDQPVLVEAKRLYREAVDTLLSASPTRPATEHHAHLMRAAAELKAALEGGMDVELAFKPLRAGYDALQKASRTLPGFEMVAFEQGCCSVLHRAKA